MQINDGEGQHPRHQRDPGLRRALKKRLRQADGLQRRHQAVPAGPDGQQLLLLGRYPDLKLKPEISGVGGSIYSATDPAISGGYYD